MPPRVLLTSVFKPFAVDGIYSRKESKIELYHNQLTKSQGIFSPRIFTDSLGLYLIANNIEVPTTVLDFPTLERFRRELRKGYDVVGIGAIMPNFQKVKRMVEETREISPRSTIVLGGFCANVPDIEKMMDVDHVCVGEGISFMRDLLGLAPEFEFRHPSMYTSLREIIGIPLSGVNYPMIIVGLGCSYGCDFCSPSHFFGRRHIRFLRRGREIFEQMEMLYPRYGSNMIAFMGDDNFLLDLDRAEELREYVVKSNKIFNIWLFASADKVVQFGAERLAEMGTQIIWIGRESKYSDYPKNRELDMKEVLTELRRHGIRTILSSILLLDQHTKENIREDIDDHLACRPVFSQFALYSPAPRTPLYDRLSEEGKILTAIPFEEWHAFKQPWFIHPEFTLMEAERIQEEAYKRDYHELGPSAVRWAEADFEGWYNMKDSRKPHLRARAEYLASKMWKYKILLLAIEHLVPTEEMREISSEMRRRIEQHFGPTGPFHNAIAAGLFLTGRFREFRTRHWGDALQPSTRVVRYNQ